MMEVTKRRGYLVLYMRIFYYIGICVYRYFYLKIRRAFNLYTS